MARKRGFLGRIVDAVFKRGREAAPPPPPSSAPRAPSIGPLRQRAVRHITTLIPMSNTRNVTNNVAQMTVDELMWTVRATADQLRWRAGQSADRMRIRLDGSYVPVNPWWYN